MEEKLTVAVVLKPQGIRGEIKVKPLCDSPEDLKAFKRVLIGGAEYSVLSVRTSDGFAFLGLKGIADRNAAELLRDADVEVFRSDAPALPEGRYYVVDLIGCGVYTEKNAYLGEVTFVTPAKTDIYTLSCNGREVSFAAADGVILSVDTATKKICVDYKRFKEVSV